MTFFSAPLRLCSCSQSALTDSTRNLEHQWQQGANARANNRMMYQLILQDTWTTTQLQTQPRSYTCRLVRHTVTPRHSALKLFDRKLVTRVKVTKYFTNVKPLFHVIPSLLLLLLAQDRLLLAQDGNFERIILSENQTEGGWTTLKGKTFKNTNLTERCTQI